MSHFPLLHVRRLVTVAMAGALVSGGVVAVTATATAGGMTVVTPRGTATSFTTGITASPVIYGVAAGSDGNVWFTERGAAKIGRITPAGTVTEFPVMGSPKGIAKGPDGNMWLVTEQGIIFRVKPDGTMTSFSNSDTAAAYPYEITAGPDNAMWFAGVSTAKVYRVSMSGAITSFADPLGGEPAGIATGPDGAVWFTDYTAGAVLRVVPDGGVDVVASGLGGAPFGIAAGPDGAMWVADPGANNVDRIQMDGTVTTFAVPTASASPWNIIAGPDGAMWFVELSGAKIGRITMDGHFTEYPVGSQPESLTAASDGSIWTGPLSEIDRVTTGLAGAPLSATAVGANGAANVSWQVPTDSGFNSISSYKVTTNPGGATCVTAFTTCMVKGLKNGTAYRFTVQAANSLGFSPATTTTSPTTPKAAPSTPRSVAVKFPKKGSVTVSWKVPVAANGAPITGYQVKWTVVASGATTAWTTTAKATLTKAGFVKGQKILVQVRAVNSAGTSPIASLKFSQGK